MKKFSSSINGYNKEEVNKFIINVTNEFESMLNKLKTQDNEIEILKKKNTKYEDLEDILNKTISVAEDTSREMKKLAKEEGQSIVNEAKRNASRIVNEALIKYKEIERDAEELQRRVVNFKRKFKQAIETEVEVIDEIADKY